MTHASSAGNGVMKVLKYPNRTKYFGPTFKGDHDRLSLNGDAYYAIEETSKHSVSEVAMMYSDGVVSTMSRTKLYATLPTVEAGYIGRAEGGQEGF